MNREVSKQRYSLVSLKLLVSSYITDYDNNTNGDDDDDDYSYYCCYQFCYHYLTNYLILYIMFYEKKLHSSHLAV